MDAAHPTGGRRFLRRRTAGIRRDRCRRRPRPCWPSQAAGKEAVTAVGGAAIMRGTQEVAMTTATTAPPLPDVPSDVLDFARKQTADEHIRPVLTMARA